VLVGVPTKVPTWKAQVGSWGVTGVNSAISFRTEVEKPQEGSNAGTGCKDILSIKRRREGGVGMKWLMTLMALAVAMVAQTQPDKPTIFVRGIWLTANDTVDSISRRLPPELALKGTSLGPGYYDLLDKSTKHLRASLTFGVLGNLLLVTIVHADSDHDGYEAALEAWRRLLPAPGEENKRRAIVSGESTSTKYNKKHTATIEAIRLQFMDDFNRSFVLKMTSIESDKRPVIFYTVEEQYIGFVGKANPKP